MGAQSFPVILGATRAELVFVLSDSDIVVAKRRVLAAYDAGQSTSGDIGMRRKPDGSWAVMLRTEPGSRAIWLQRELQREQPGVRVVTSLVFRSDRSWNG